MRPDLSICIANHRTPELTLACLRSIAQHSGGLDVEVLLANNTPDDQEQLAAATAAMPGRRSSCRTSGRCRLPPTRTS